MTIAKPIFFVGGGVCFGGAWWIFLAFCMAFPVVVVVVRGSGALVPLMSLYYDAYLPTYLPACPPFLPSYLYIRIECILNTYAWISCTNTLITIEYASILPFKLCL